MKSRISANNLPNKLHRRVGRFTTLSAALDAPALAFWRPLYEIVTVSMGSSDAFHSGPSVLYGYRISLHFHAQMSR